MKNPLSRRLLRELRQDIGKYIALFLFLTLTTGFISGFLVADGSMVKAYDESFEKYDIESGHFILEDKLPDETRAKLEAAGVSVHELFYKEATLDNENTVRIFQNRSEVNKTDVLEGRLPESEGEIAADRLYLENNGLTIGDELAGLKITGAVALSDYSALFKNNTDMMLDANKFCVAVVTPETFDEIDENVHLCYAWLNNDKTLSDEQCRDKSDELGEILAADCGISDIVERSENQAISFTGEDMGSDKAMMTTLLYVVKFASLPTQHSHLYLAISGVLAAVICIADPLRSEVRGVMDSLRALGLDKLVMMTGDSERTAAAVAKYAGVDEYYAEVLPEDKAAFIRAEHEKGRKVIMIGDGVNDSPALSEADAGIAMSDGAAIAREIADVTICSDDLESLVTLKRISDGLMQRIHANYRFIISFNTGLIVLGVAGVLPPSTSALLHNISTLGIGLRSMRNLLP